MKQNGFFNLILVLSFLLSSLGGIPSNQTTYATARISWNIKANIGVILDRIDSWLDSLRTDTSKIVGITPIGISSTATPTPGFGIAPTIEPTRTLEPTLSPTLPPTETFTPTLAPTEAISPILTPTPEGGFTLSNLVVSLDPDPAAPGDVVTATWTINNYHGQFDGVEVWLYLPEAFIPLEIGEGSFNPETNLLILPIHEASGLLSWFIDGSALPPFDILMEVHWHGQVILSVTRSLGERGPDLIPMGGGEAHGFNRHVKVNFPAGALPEDVDVMVRAPQNADLSLGGRPMQLTAISRASGMEITQFNQPVTITVHYTDEEANRLLENAGMKDENSLTLYYYDRTEKTWYPLTTSVNAETNQLTATTDHFTLFDFKAQNWEAARLPNLDGFQLSGFTGAATYSYPIQVPPGPGGLQPTLELSYNTQEVDSSSSRTQASWVGMGWSLDTGYVQRNMNGTPDYVDDDTFTLVLNGVGGLLLPIADQDGDSNTIDYHFANERFWRVRQYLASGDVGGYTGDHSQWVVFAPDGTQYYFGNYSDGGLGGHAWYPAYPDLCNTVIMQTWRWSLTRIRNTFGKELTYTYFYEYLPKYGNGCSGLSAYMAVAVYPDSIIYPNNHYRVVFVRNTDAGGSGLRTDYELTWKDHYESTTLFMQSTLKQIETWNDPNGIWKSGDEILIRKYVLGYGENGQQLFPNVTWNAGGKTPTLTSITEFGLNGTTALPAVTFTYDNMHLDEVKNGYGGDVNFGYNNWHADGGNESYLFDPDGVQYGTGEFYPDNFNDNELDFMKSYFQPGVYYKIVAEVWPTAGGSSVQLGLDDGITHVYGDLTNLTWAQWNTITSYVVISGAASQARALFKCNGGCTLGKYEVFPLVTRYRITSKTITDYVTNASYTYTYAYEGAAVNDTTHSAYVAADPSGVHLMTKPNTEFRGHSHVTEADPDGRVVETWFYQDDVYKGQVYQTQVKDSSGYIYTQSSSSYTYEEEQTYNLPHPQGQPADSDLKILWVYTTSEEDRTYHGPSSYVATRMDYQYYASDQGGTQYGNRTRTISSYWDGFSWVAYRGSRTQYYPEVSNGTPVDSRYLTGLPGYTNTFQCPGGCDWATTDLMSSQWYLYDGNTMFNLQPVDGKLTGNRTMIYFATPPTTDPMYSDTSYTNDAWGNRTVVTQYTGYTSLTSFGTDSHPQTTYTCYGGGGSLNGYDCSDDGYYTYPSWERNALDRPTTFTYDKGKGVLMNVNDQNNIDTSATYDVYGRILTVVRSGDDSNNPTIRISYHEASAPFLDNPFWTEAQQRITGSTYFVMRKYYNGMGQLLQTQVVGATIGTLTRDILADTFYDPGGRVYQQTVPYDMATGSYYHTRSTLVAHTTTTYDILGRIATSLATDGTSTTYSYWNGYISNIPYLYTMVTNPRTYSTTTQSDIWGRVVLVTPATGPTVSYTYDAADRLLTTTRGGATTTLSYDIGGRKTNMADPDMGAWVYTYDALGNLKTQTDARACITTLAYDLLNRLTGKTYSGTCSGTTAVSYTYDYGTNGIGRRTGMTDGSGNTSWTYDNRGRMTQESKAITGSGTFKTQWGYNSADLVSSMTYPNGNGGGSGEVVNYTYLNQLLLDTVTGTNIYVNNTDYDAAGRVDVRDLGWNGSNPVVRVDYTYFNWTDVNGQGRLSQITSGSVGTPTSLQDLRYTYDENGNVKTIIDNKAGPQTQTFSYDGLDRLTSAYTTGGTNGTYNQSYNYSSSTGNINTMAGSNYTYSTVHPHAVENSVGTGGTNKTVTIRAKGVYGCSAWPTMELRINGTLRNTWTVSSSSYQNYSVSTNITGNDRVEVVYTNDNCILEQRDLYVDYVVVNGTTVQAEGTSTIIDWGTGTQAYDWQNVIAGQEAITSNGALRFVLGSQAFADGYDANGNMTTRLLNGTRYLLSYDAENHLVNVSGSATATFVYDGDGNRVKATVGTTTTYIGNYLEYTTSGIVKYYYAGNTRVAMCTSSGALKFLLGDHLGSTSITTNSSGVYQTEVWYYPWGGQRWSSGTPPTTFRFSGQRLQSEIGLYFYNARWYDPAAGRFLQPDTVVPVGVQGLDRYAYTLNNPINYTDPTGHNICDEEGNCYFKDKIISHFKSITTNPEEFFTKDLLQSPLKGEYKYGNYLSGCTTLNCTGLHPGVDSQNINRDDGESSIVNYKGRPIYAAANGVVVSVGYSQWGNYVLIEHDVYGITFYSVYAHLDDQTVNQGDVVTTETIIGTMGNTKPGCSNCDIHLHFEVRQANNINLSQADPFLHMTWWPQTIEEFHQKWVDISPLMH